MAFAPSPAVVRSSLVPLLPLALLLLLASCCPTPPCPVVPALDATPPAIVVIVEYTDLAGAPQSKSIDWSDPAIVIDMKKEAIVRLTFYGRDPEGMRYLHVDGHIRATTSSGLVSDSPIDQPIREASCPVSGMVGNNEWPANATARDIIITVEAKNWHGLSRTTQEITLRQR